jgi:hypothetical protein
VSRGHSATIWAHTLALSLFLTSVSIAADSIAPNQPISAIMSRLSPIELQIDREYRGQLENGIGPFMWATDKGTAAFGISRTFHIKIPLDGKYSIQYQSDDRLLGLHVIDEDGNLIALQTDTSVVVVQKFAFSATKGRDVWITLGVGSTKDPVQFRLGVYSDASGGLGPNQLRQFTILNSNSAEKYPEPKDADGIGFPVKFFKLANPNAGKWMAITAESDKIIPYIVLLDNADEEIKDVRRTERRNSSHVVIDNNKVKFSTIAVLNVSSIEKPGKEFDLRVDEYTFDPDAGVIKRLSFFLSDPLVSFASGSLLALLITLLIGYYFYRRSVAGKTMYMTIERDSLIVNTEKNGQALIFDLNKTPIHCASVCTARLSIVGRGYVVASDVLKPLTLKLTNVIRIITHRAEMSVDSWRIPTLVDGSAATFKLDFESLATGDDLRISMLCEQESPMSITAVLDGRIKDVSFKVQRVSFGELYSLGVQLIVGILLGAVAGVPTMWLAYETDAGPLLILTCYIFNFIIFAYIYVFILRPYLERLLGFLGVSAYPRRVI